LKDKPNHRKALQLRASITTILGRLPDAIRSYKQALSLCKPIRDFWVRVSILESIGSAYWRLKEPDLAIKYTKMALELYDAYYQWGQEAFEEPIALNLWSIGEYQTKSGKLSEAITTYERLLENLSKDGSLQAFAETFYELGSLYYRLNDLDKALPKFLRATNIFESFGKTITTGYCHYFLGCIFFAQKEFKRSLDHLKTGIAHMEGSYSSIHRISEKEEDRFYKRAVRLRNSLEWKGVKGLRYFRSLLLPKRRKRPSSSDKDFSEFLQWLISPLEKKIIRENNKKC